MAVIDCKSAMEQGYPDLAHKMGCDLPNTGTNLGLWVVLVLALLVLGGCLIYAARRRGAGE